MHSVHKERWFRVLFARQREGEGGRERENWEMAGTMASGVRGFAAIPEPC